MRLIDKNQVHFGGKSLYGVALVGNALLLGAAVAMSRPLASGCLAAAACGLQNAMCTSHFGAVVRTTHVTGTLTDLGSTLGRLAMMHLRHCRRQKLNILEKAEVGVDLRKLLVLLPMWVAYVLGSTIGAYFEHVLGSYALLIPASCTLTLGLVYTLLRPFISVNLRFIFRTLKPLKTDCKPLLQTSLSAARSLLKETIKRFEQERLSEKIREVQLAFVRTGSRPSRPSREAFGAQVGHTALRKPAGHRRRDAW